MRPTVRGGLVILMCACSGPTAPNRTGSFTGTVTLDGAPLAGATVELIGQVVNPDLPQTTPFVEMDPPLAVTETGPDGSYRLEAYDIPEEACGVRAFVRLEWDVPLDYGVPSPCLSYDGADFAISSGPT